MKNTTEIKWQPKHQPLLYNADSTSFKHLTIQSVVSLSLKFVGISETSSAIGVRCVHLNHLRYHQRPIIMFHKLVKVIVLVKILVFISGMQNTHTK